MSTINLRELKRRLPYGSIVRIADATGITAKAVTEVLNHGWHPQHMGPVCDAALSILDETKIDPDITRHAKEHGLTSAHSIYVPTRSRKKKFHYERSEPKLNWDDLSEMDEDQLMEVCDSIGLEISFWGRVCADLTGNLEEGLRSAIADRLGIDNPDSLDEDPDEDE